MSPPVVVMPVSRNLNGFTIRNQDGINAKTIQLKTTHVSFIDIKNSKKSGIF